VVVMRAADLGKSGQESPADLEKDRDLKSRVEAIRLEAGRLMNLGDVTAKTVPKMCLVAPPRNGGAVSTRTFIPHKVHTSIGVFGAVSVASACVLPGSVTAGVAQAHVGAGQSRLDIEHPTGFFTVETEVENGLDGVRFTRSALLRTARMLMRGEVLVPGSVWTKPA
jgi:4-oxalomesaconate tautomerase